ncbi:MAG: 3-phosphoserine/phosphohydroxythreonine transaminase [Candidatus Limnocylindrales bacterium]
MSPSRLYNFSSGPAVMPLPVLEQVQRDLLALPGVGMSILEISHRSKTFESIIEQTQADLRRLAAIPDNYRILFLQGGASLQFSMVPLNLLTEGRTADYVMTGTWADKAVKEARRVGSVNATGSTQADGYARIPTDAECRFTTNAAYVHMTSNNTIEGTQWQRLPQAGAAPLVSDASSDIFSRPIDIARHGLIYAGAQKNLGPSGVVLVIIREDLLERSPRELPTMLSYAVQADNNSLYNTPPTFGIYVLGLVVQWLLELGGLPAMAEINERKAGCLYAELDRTGFWRPTAEPASRSLMNVTFRLASEELEAAFVKEATAAGFDGLKGHRSVGGMRASIYNAFPAEGIDRLIEFMREFERVNG